MQSPFSPFVHRVRTVKDFKRRQSEVKSDLIDWDAPEIPELDKQRIIYEEFIKELNEDHAIEMLISEELYQIAHEAYVDTIQTQQDDIVLKERSQVNLLLGQVKMFEAHSQEQESTIRELEGQVAELESHKEDAANQLEEMSKRFAERADHSQEIEGTIRELKCQVAGLENQVALLESQKEEATAQVEEMSRRLAERKDPTEDIVNLMCRNTALDELNKDLDFQNKELELRNKELEAEMGTQLEMFVAKKAEAEDLKMKYESAKNQLSYYKKLSKKRVA